MSENAPIHVVHLDDDRDLLDLTQELIEREHDAISIHPVTTPEEALDAIETEPVDCVVTDYKMASMDGLEFLRTIRRDHPTLPVIFFTGKGSEELASEAISLGVTDYLQKGGGMEQFKLLGNRIDTLVSKQRAEVAAAEANERIREIYERITVAFFAVDDHWRFTYLNNDAKELFDVRDVIGQSFWEQFPGLRETELESHLRRAMTEQQPESFQGEIPSLGRYVEMHAYPAEDGISVFVEDITEQHEQEAELEHLRNELEITEQQFRTLRQKLSRPPSPFR
ncbi:response regulator [Natronomonas sp. EA1]|uniref:response regulator n=1 Tax=Natronomonas sp. EA1 TaxID=3421655 RepID=UPI003EBDB5DC